MDLNAGFFHRALARVAIAATLTFAAASQTHAAVGYSNMFIFGDSLSETGNYAALGLGAFAYPAPYAPGRFSNGPVWVDYLGDALGIAVTASEAGGNNHAWGGARTVAGTPLPPPFHLATHMDVQTADFVNANPGGLDADALYVVWGGGNDALAGDVQETANNLGDIITALADAGARRFMVPNLPVFAPAFGAVNSALAPVLDGLEATLPIQLTRVDVASVFAAVTVDVLANGGGTFGFTSLAPCLTATSLCSDPASHVMWDNIHPSSGAHRLIADAALAALAPVPVPPGLLLAAAPLVLLARRRAA